MIESATFYGVESFYIHCDECPSETLQFDGIDWHEMIEKVKKAGWRIQKDVNDRFIHLCPNCA